MRSPAVAFLLAFVAAAPAAAATPSFGPQRSFLPLPLFGGSPLPAPTLEAGDVNGDGRADVSLGDGVDIGVLLGTADTGFLNNPVSFIPAYVASSPGTLSGNELLTDLTADGLADVLAVEEATSEVMLSPADGFGAFAPGCGCGGGIPIVDLTDPAGANASGVAQTLVRAGDLDGDGIKDLVVSDEANAVFYVYRGVSNDWLASPPVFATAQAYPSGLSLIDFTVGDFEGGAADEVALTWSDGSASVLDPGAGLTFPSSLALTPLGGGSADPAQQLLAGDVTGDGRDDLIVSDPIGGQVVVYRGGTGFGAGAQSSPAIADASLLAAGDLNADGRDEIVVAVDAGDSTLTVLEGSATGATTVLTTLGADVFRPSGLAVGDFDGDGREDIVSSTDDFLNYFRNVSLPVAAAGAPGDFGSQAVGTMGAAKTVTVTNTGAAPLKVTSVRSSSDDFVVSGESCVGERIAAGATCAARVRFAPTATGSRSGTLSIAGNSASAGTAALTGTGTEAASGGGTGATGPQGIQGEPGPQGVPGPKGEPGFPISRGHARCRVRSQQRIQCVVYNAKTVPWRFTGIKDGKLGNRIIRPGRYRLTVIHVMSSGRLRVFRRFVRVR
jgi:hypothetical protein